MYEKNNAHWQVLCVHFEFDGLVRLVPHDDEIGDSVVANVGSLVGDAQGRKGPRLEHKLGPNGLDVVGVQMHIAHVVDEFVRDEAAVSREKVRQYRVRGNVERHA